MEKEILANGHLLKRVSGLFFCVALCAVSFLGKEAANLPRYLAWCHSLQSDFYSERREKETVKSLFVIFDVFLPFLSLLLGLLAGNR